MNLAWYVARASGLVSWALLAFAVTWGFFLSTRVLGARPRPRWIRDLHRFLGGLAVIFVGVHLGALLIDSYVPFSPVQLLVPFTSDYRPTAVSFGIVAFYVLVAVELTSLAMKHLPRRTWHLIHVASYGLFVVATVHLLMAGTDSSNVVVRWLAIVALVECVVFALLRLGTTRSARRQVGVPSSKAALAETRSS